LSIQVGTIQTLNIDKLAMEGIRLNYFNARTRALQHDQLRILSTCRSAQAPVKPPLQVSRTALAAWEYTFLEWLFDADYSTALFGKWCLGMNINKLPNTRGKLNLIFRRIMRFRSLIETR